MITVMDFSNKWGTLSSPWLAPYHPRTLLPFPPG